TDQAPFSIVMLNSVVRKTQRYLANNGLTSNIVDNFILTPITPVANQDPGTQCFISALNYFDGVLMHTQPVLPPDCLLVLDVYQRQTGSGAQFVWMSPAKGGLMSRIPGPYFGEWEWRNDAINFVGCSNSMDMRVRYEGRLPRIAKSAVLSNTTINIRDGEDALAMGLVAHYGFSRGAAQRAEAKAEWKENCDELVNRYVRKDQRIAYRPKGYAAGGGTIDGALSGDYR
ncbi:MAG: hypothetical protein HRJ53_26210, partial [Acidobacteria bacterium Pan2503]|nr:hypothetical protein [Candidatus Acidoferrum panamensis]